MVPAMLASSAGGAGVFLFIAIAANYVIGRSIRDRLELQREDLRKSKTPHETAMFFWRDKPGLSNRSNGADAELSPRWK